MLTDTLLLYLQGISISIIFLYKYLIHVHINTGAIIDASSGPNLDLVVEPYAIVNNMSEAFNSVIVDARGKPIITMLEEIRVYLMEWWATKRKKVTTFEGNICPKVLGKLHKENELTKY